MIDSHCHLHTMPSEKACVDERLSAMTAAGVEAALVVSLTLEDAATLRTMVTSHPERLRGTVGLHPTEQPGEPLELERLEQLASEPWVLAVGETGLDFHHVPPGSSWQHERFEQHLHVANRLQKPVVVHMRDATEATLAALKAWGSEHFVIHCFTETWDVAKRVLDLGGLISLSGIVTFKNARSLHDVAKQVPLDRLLIETDAPYLAPVPHRGKVNEPAWVAHVAQYIADLRGTSVDNVAAATMANTRAFFQWSSASLGDA